MIDRLEGDILFPPRAPQVTAGASFGCQVHAFRLQSVKKGKKWAVRVVKTGTKPRLNVTCSVSADGNNATETLRLKVKRRGKGTLRQAVGKKLNINVHRGTKPPSSGATEKMAITFA